MTEYKFIIIAILALIISVKVFANSKALAVIVGYCGVYAILLICWNTLLK
jgi:hypothetical protein